MHTQSKQKRISFGYNRGPIGQLEIHPGQAATVKLIYKMYKEGKSLSKIAEALENAEVPSPQNKSKWGRQILSNILSNVHYIGADDFPVLIDKEEFQSVQKIKGSHAKK